MRIYVGQVFKHYLLNKCFCKLGNFGTLIIYIIGIFLNWRQLAAVCILCAIPYVLGLILCLPNDFPYQNLSRMKSYTTEKLVDEDSSDLMYNKVSIYFYLLGNQSKVWKIPDFSVTQILREINFWESRSFKMVVNKESIYLLAW